MQLQHYFEMVAWEAPSSMTKSETRRVVFQPGAYRGVQRGINQIVEAIRPTLGPLPRAVAVERTFRGDVPEILDNGGVIARRIIELPDRDEDVGAMFIRHLLWRLHETAGDGTATAAVLFQSVFNQGVKYIASGGNAMRLRHYLEKSIPIILGEMDSMAVHLEGKEKLAQLAEAICHDPPLARMLGEIFDIIGEHGQLEIRLGRGRELEREYIEGMYWKGGLLSRQMIRDHPKLRTQLENAAILVSDLKIEEPRQLASLVDQAIQVGIGSLLIVAQKLSESAISVLLAASRDPTKFQAIAVRTPNLSLSERVATLEDMAILTGGRLFTEAAGSTLSQVKPQDLGRARRAWADLDHFGLVGGKGDPRLLRQHIAHLRAGFKQTQDPEVRKKLRERIGKLLGGSATLWVGGATEVEIKERKERAERTAEALRGAMMEGVLPGGGVALLDCRPTLRRMLAQATDPDERTAYRILIRTLEEPIRTILANAGYDACEIMAEIRQAGPGHGFDVRCGRVVDMAQAGIFDVATAQKEAVRVAVTSAALALTIDVLVHRQRRSQATTP